MTIFCPHGPNLVAIFGLLLPYFVPQYYPLIFCPDLIMESINCYPWDMDSYKQLYYFCSDKISVATFMYYKISTSHKIHPIKDHT